MYPTAATKLSVMPDFEVYTNLKGISLQARYYVGLGNSPLVFPSDVFFLFIFFDECFE